MNIFNILSLLVGIASLVCYVIVIIDAFEDEFFRGLLCVVFPPYAWWYGWVEFEHEKKWLIFSLMVAGPFVTGALTQAAIRSEVDRIQKQRATVRSPSLDMVTSPIRLLDA